MEASEKSVQNSKNKRSQSDRICSLKYNQQILKQSPAQIEEARLIFRTVFSGLKGYFNLVSH
jgi:hypothetical protein